jgi:hypothetical protein
VILEIAFPRAHDIEVLIGLLPKHAQISLTVEQQRKLTEYATVMRYPGACAPATLTEAKEAVKLARPRPTGDSQAPGRSAFVLTQAQAAQVLKVSQSRVSDLTTGKWEKFSLEMLIALATRAGLHVSPKTAA